MVRGNARRSTCVLKEPCSQRRRLAAGLEFEKRRARLQSVVLKIELEIIINLFLKRSTYGRC